MFLGLVYRLRALNVPVGITETLALAGALAMLAGRPALRREMGAAARRRVVADFALDDQADAFAALFRRVA